MNIISQLAKGRKRWVFIATDVLVSLLVILAVNLIGLSFSDVGSYITARWYVFLIQIALYPILYAAFLIYRTSWVYCNAWEPLRA